MRCALAGFQEQPCSLFVRGREHPGVAFGEINAARCQNVGQRPEDEGDITRPAHLRNETPAGLQGSEDPRDQNAETRWLEEEDLFAPVRLDIARGEFGARLRPLLEPPPSRA